MDAQIVAPDEERAHKFILEVLSSTDEPLSTFELFDRAEDNRPPLGQELVRRAIWNLVDAGKLTFTRDRRLTETIAS